MSRKESPSTALAAAVTLGLGIGGIAQGFANTSDAHSQLHETERQLTQKLHDAKQTVPVLEGGTAIIKLNDGRRVTIKNPFMIHSDPTGEHDHTFALGRNPDTAAEVPVQGFYGEKGGINDDVKASNIAYTQNGHQISTSEAVARATQERVGINGLGEFVVAAGQAHSGEVVGEMAVQAK